MPVHKLLVAQKVVSPAKAGIQYFQRALDSPVKPEDDKKRLYAKTLFNFFFPYADRFLPESVNEMMEGHVWITVEHPGAGVTHDLLYLFFHGGFVAVHLAIPTGCFSRLEGTSVQPL